MVHDSGDVRCSGGMDSTLKPSGADPLLARYVALPTECKQLVRLKTLIYFPTGKPEFQECLTHAKLHGPDGKAWPTRTLNGVIDEMQRQGLLDNTQACAPALRHAVAIDAMESEAASSLMEAVRTSFPVTGQAGFYHFRAVGDRDMLHRVIRLAIYDNDLDAFAAAMDRYQRDWAPRHPGTFLATVFADTAIEPAWLESRRPPLLAAVLDAKLLAFSTDGVAGPDLPGLIALCRPRLQEDEFGHFRHVVLRYDLLSGHLDAVRQGLTGLDGDDTATVLALEGSSAFLEGRNDAALAYFRDALKAHRKDMGRRKVFLDGAFGLFFLLAMLRANDAKLHGEIQTGIDVIRGNDEPSAYRYGFVAIQTLLWLVQGMEAKARSLLEQLSAMTLPEPLSAACVALAEHAVDTDLSRARDDDLAERFDDLRDLLPMIARIYAEILAKVAAKPAPYRDWLDAQGAGPIVRFTEIVQTRQSWERALESLDAFLDAGAPKTEAAKAPRKTKRMAWFVNPDTREIEIAEQSTKSKDGWTDGRGISMKRLHEQDPRLDYLTDHDRRALRTIRKDGGTGWYNPEVYYFDHSRTLVALVGHPLVFDARQRSQPLDLVSYPLELVVSEHRDGYRVALSHSAERPEVFLEAETPTRYRVVEFPQKLLAVQEILGRDGLIVPKAARDQVVAMVRRNSPALPIRAEIAEVELPGQEGQSAPVVQLVPYEQGLTLTLLVRPFGADGPAYVAGLGGRSVLAAIGGQQIRVNRDLPRELAERTALIEACPTLRDRCGTEQHELVVEDPEGCLELLLELRAYTGSVTLEWPEGRSMRVSPVAAGNLKMRVGQDRDWFNVEGSVALDDEQVLEMRFLLERLDKAQGRFVPLGDGRFVALTRQLQAQLQRLAAVSEPHRTGRRVHALGAPALDAVLEDAGEVKTDTAWKKHVARIKAAENWTPVLPSTLQAELRDYQVEGFVWLSRLARWGAGACLADDMGLGKTVQAIAVMLDRAEEGPCLVVAPTSVCPNWEAEIARFAPTLSTHRLASVADRAALIAGLGPRDVLVCSYGLLHQAGEALSSRPWQMAVLDEAQAIKNAETQRARATQNLQAGFRLALTGTPIENYLDELWSLFSFVNPGVLGSREGFQKRFARPIERDRDPHARQALRALIRPFLLRRTKAAVLSELPPRTEQTLTIEMGEAENAFYEALRQRSLERIAASDAKEGRRKIQILAEITRLRRACCNPALIDAVAGVPSGKLGAFMDLVEELIRNRHKALVFSQFVGHLDLVRAALDARGIRYEYLDGSTPSAEREKRVAAFQAGGAELFLISLRAGGTGLNLTAADYVVHLDPWWNPAVEDQASDRAHRIGQERPVTVYRLIMRDSIEERILALHRDKRDLASELLDGTETAARLSEEELLDLIRG